MDFTNAKKIFADYLKQYDASDEKIKLKIVHTYGVVEAAEYIALGMGLSAGDTDLARHIGLLHDIGRFEQLRQFHSFDDALVSHTGLGLSILFDDHMIEQFIEERNQDSIIYASIKNHGLYRLEPGLTGKALLHSQIIRDADKLDNFRVKELDSITAMLDVTEVQLGAEDVSLHIYEKFMNREPILNSERITHMDMWISYLAHIFDLNFPVSRSFIRNHQYINKLIDRIPYANRDTAEKMEQIRSLANDYLSLNAEEGSPFKP